MRAKATIYVYSTKAEAFRYDHTKIKELYEAGYHLEYLSSQNQWVKLGTREQHSRTGERPWFWADVLHRVSIPETLITKTEVATINSTVTALSPDLPNKVYGIGGEWPTDKWMESALLEVLLKESLSALSDLNDLIPQSSISSNNPAVEQTEKVLRIHRELGRFIAKAKPEVDVDKCVKLIVDTNDWAGNFERELCAFITGQLGECGKGRQIARLRIEDGEIKHLGWWTKHIVQVPDEQENPVYRPVSIFPTPGFYNTGDGTIVAGIDKTKAPAYLSVAIYVDELPPKPVMDEFVKGAYRFFERYPQHKNIITGMRVLHNENNT